ncbi:MAG TPA: DUF1549 and DUF1553 domain-containing protein [Chthonomonadaceae bacterium]|nr:DUF1549 and DUF1553 domain-containing protein [Chthonomonadaceae bacterium]
MRSLRTGKLGIGLALCSLALGLTAAFAQSKDNGAKPAAPPTFGPPQVNAETMNFWSFRPVKRPNIPAVKNTAWVKSPIDAFVLAKLEANGLQPAPPASRQVLIRRAYYDLIGLPPSPQDVQAFVADTAPNAWEKLIDRLLASPQYGERWGRHWLDLVRYAESNSFERDSPKPYVWRYRDYVIRSLNADKPYDQFIREQLAGDELEAVTPDTLIATGYYRLGQWDDEPADPEQARYDELDDIITTTGQTFLGLTVNCGRCHDHKLDPIPQKDYYRMLSFFQGITRYGPPVEGNSLRSIAFPEEQQRFERENSAYKQKLEAIRVELTGIEAIARKDFSPVEREEFKGEMNRIPILKKRAPGILSEAQFQRYVALTQQRADLLKSPPKGLEQALCVTESGADPAPTHVLLRGNPHVPGDEVTPAFLSVLAPPTPNIRTANGSSGRRLALANWIASKDNQLTARVMVNRIWQYHFGRGIVRSTSNFGNLGNRPTHPELLDWLASEFVADGWKLKPLHKQILMSNAYKMSSQSEPKALAKDPENDLLWRFDMRRLEAEEVRDSILAVNGSLNPKMFGPPIYPTIPPEVLAGQSVPGAGWEKSPPEEQTRRSIYIHIKRSLTVPLLARFDAADTDLTCPVRFATTQPTQALSMLNSTFLNDQARIFAASLLKQAGSDPKAQVRLALWRTLQREPTAKEIERGVKFIQSTVAEQQVSEAEALRFYCVIALNLNEFLYLD